MELSRKRAGGNTLGKLALIVGVVAIFGAVLFVASPQFAKFVSGTTVWAYDFSGEWVDSLSGLFDRMFDRFKAP